MGHPQQKGLQGQEFSGYGLSQYILIKRQKTREGGAYSAPTPVLWRVKAFIEYKLNILIFILSGSEVSATEKWLQELFNHSFSIIHIKIKFMKVVTITNYFFLKTCLFSTRQSILYFYNKLIFFNSLKKKKVHPSKFLPYARFVNRLI